MIPVEVCPVCGGTDLRPFAMNPWSRESLHFAQARCKNCRLLMAQPQASDEEIEEYYRYVYFLKKWPDPEAIWKNNLQSYDQYELPLMRMMWDGWPPPESAEAIEVGCGYGVMLEKLRKLGYKARGVDPSPKAVDYCNSRGLIATVGKCPGLRVPPSSFDLALAFQVVEHVRDPVAFVNELVGLVRPGGVIVIATEDATTSQYFAEHLGARLRFRFPAFRSSTDHTFVFRGTHLKKLLLKAGCDEVRIQNYTLVPKHESLHWRAYKGFFRGLDRILEQGEFLITVAHRAKGIGSSHARTKD